MSCSSARLHEMSRRRHVVITGASSGIGLATAERLERTGVALTLLSRTPPPTLSRFNETQVHYESTDVGHSEDVATALRSAESRLGQIDSLVCAAGIASFGSVEDSDPAYVCQQIQTNYVGVVNAVRGALPSVRSSNGRIVIIGSLAAAAPIPFQAHYSATKAAVAALGHSLALELRPSGVHVAVVEPGDIDTSFNRNAMWLRSSDSYAAAAGRVEEVVRQGLLDGPPPDVVAKTVCKALSTRRPRALYRVGPKSVQVGLGSRLLPHVLQRYLIARHFGVAS